MAGANAKPSQLEVVANRVTTNRLDVAGITLSQGAPVASIAATTNILAVPAAFADLPAVQAYLDDPAMVANIESRLDAIEAAVNAILAQLRASGVIGV